MAASPSKRSLRGTRPEENRHIQKLYEIIRKFNGFRQSSNICALISRAGAVCTTDASEPRGVDVRCVVSSAVHSQSISTYSKSEVHCARSKCLEIILSYSYYSCHLMPYLFVFHRIPVTLLRCLVLGW